MLDGSPDPIFVKDREGRLVLADPATFTAIGKPAEACLGKTDEQFLDNPADGRAVMATDHCIMASGQAETVEEMISTPSGTRYFVSNKAPCHDAAGNVVGLIGTARDITERKRTEAALRESEERFRGIFQDAGTAIAITDLQGRFHSCNPAFTALLGYSQAELLDRLLPRHHSSGGSRRECRRRSAAAAPEIASLEIFNRYIKRTVQPSGCTSVSRCCTTPPGKPTHHIALVTDMTERKRYEEHIRGGCCCEVNHRSKNMLAVVQAVARQTIASSPDDFLARFGERIRVLAAAQDLLIKNEWKGAEVGELFAPSFRISAIGRQEDHA